MTQPATARPTPWTNWAGNQTFSPREYATPESEEEVAALVAGAAERGLTVRPMGTGHSSPPVCTTDGLIVNLERLRGITAVDREARRVTAAPGTLIADFGPVLWEHGLCLKNQGDIDAQQIAGAIATATHGSGKRLQCFSAGVRGMRVVLPTGEIVEVGEHDAALPAAQVAMGMLGVVTSVELEVTDAFQLEEKIRYWSLDEVYERWDEAFESLHHFSFFWMPATHSPDLFQMPYPDGMDMADRAYVKIYDAHPVIGGEGDGERRTAAGDRIDRPYRIYPQYGVPVFHELEHMVPFEQGKEAMAAIRDLILHKHPDCAHPVEVRSVARDTAWLSPNYERDSLVIAIHLASLDDIAFFQDAARVLAEFNARPHWGKLHFMDHDAIGRVFPKHEAFKDLRRRLDPAGVFLNDFLRERFA